MPYFHGIARIFPYSPNANTKSPGKKISQDLVLSSLGQETSAVMLLIL